MQRILPFVLFILVLSACSEVTHNDYKFTGESEHWEAEYAYKGKEAWDEEDGAETYTNKDNYDFLLKYKGSLEELSSLEKLEYSYETLSGGGNATVNFNEPPKNVTFTSSGGSKNGEKVSEDEVIQVTVKWDEFEESFELQNERK